MEDISSKDIYSVSTLVFMDLEATGLPSFVGKSNVHITEMSLVAVDRDEFEADASLRVLNKLSLCIRPRARISHGAMTITGLYNDVLENQELFDESVPKLLKYFFQRLRAPVCLLAHNGRKYDFPLLQAELKRINYSLGPKVLCVDTLEALRSILNEPKKDLLYETIENKEDEVPRPAVRFDLDLSDEVPRPAARFDINLSDEAIDSLLSEDIEIFNCINIPTLTPSEKDSNHSKDEDPQKNIAFRNEHTPKGKIISTPDEKNLKRHRKKNPDPTFSPKKLHKPSTNSDVRRKLFKNESEANGTNLPANSAPHSFSLPKLYNYFFGEDPPISHYAEADCIALSKVCQKVNQRFLKWIDKNSFPFADIEEMW